VLVSTQETSTDGRRSWSTVYRDGSTPVTTYSEVGTVVSGTRTDKVVNPDLTSVERVYTYGRLTTVLEKNSGGTQLSAVTYAYDPHGRLSSQTDARNGATSFTYYDSDSVQTTSAPVLGNGEPRQVTTSYYDSMGRNNGQLLPDGNTVTNFYHPTGLLQRTFGSRTYPVEYAYDSQGRMKTMKTWQSFNGGAGTAAVTTWNYDAYRGWLLAKDYANPTTGAAGTDGPNYTYSDGGRLASRTWARGLVTTYDYKVTAASMYSAGVLRSVSYNDPTPATTYSYDRRGRMATATRDGMTTTYTYNEADQPVGESHSGGALSGLSIARTYDSSLRLSTLDAVRSGSSVQLVGYTYDTAGRLDQVRDNNSTTHTARYTYESNSRLIRLVAFTNNASGRGMLTTRTWDRLNRLGSIHSQAHISSTSLGLGLGHTYTYNAANQRTRADLADGSYWVYEYDKLGQVISGRRYWGDGTLMAGQDFTYQFDDIGNRDTTGGRASAVSDYSANQLNQYETRTVPNKLDILGVANPGFGVQVWKDSDSPSTASRSGEYFHQALTVAYSSYPEVFAKSLFVPNQQASAGRSFVPPAIEDFDHDLDGNLIKDGRWTAYVWDGENRLIEMKRDTATPTEARQRLTFEYDHLGRRMRKRFFTWSGSDWAEQRETIYLYDGWNLVAELDGNNANATLRTYVWGTDLSGGRSGAGGVGGLLWVNNSQTTGGLPTGIHFVAYDGIGNVSGLTSATDGSSTARYEYGPFGEPLRTTGPLASANPIRWSTKVTDDESGLVYYGYRYYSWSSGRWPNRDPLGEDGGENLYLGAGNNFVNEFDVLGLKWRKAPRSQQPADKRRVVWTRDSAADTLAMLAQELELNPAEASKWAKASGSSGSCSVSVPNVWIDADLLRGGGLSDRIVNIGGTLGRAFTFSGKMEVKVNHAKDLIPTINQYKEDILGFSLYAHGWKDGTIAMPDKKIGKTPSGKLIYDLTRYTNQREVLAAIDGNGFQLSKAYVMQCYSGFVGNLTDPNTGNVVSYDWDAEWRKRVFGKMKVYHGLNVLGLDTGD
jgi:RHS repeat-associated protein